MHSGAPARATPLVPELPIIRSRAEGEQRATFFELFFDLVCSSPASTGWSS
jgi:low temperature requirement protein LtrA